MKKVLATILTLVMALSLCSVAWADGVTCEGGESCAHQAAIGSTHYNTLAEAITAASDGDTIVLQDNATTATLQDDIIYDLNSHTLTYSGTTHEVAEGKTLTFMDSSVTGNARGGTLELSGVNGTTAAINPQKGATLKVSNIKVTCTGSAFFPQGDAAKVDVTACDVTAPIYCVGTNAGSTNNYNVVITLKDSTFVAAVGDGDNCAVMINVPGTLNIDNCTITGDRQAVLVRAGTAVINNSDIKTTGKFTDAATKYHSGAWSSGNEVPAAALTVGNYQNGPASAYLAEAKVTVTNTKLTAEHGVPAIYTDANDTYKGDLTIGGDSTVVTGEVMKGQKADENVSVIAVTGGTFSSDVRTYTADNTPVAMVGNDYAVGSSAISAAANGGKTVIVVKAGPINGVDAGKSITVNRDVTGVTVNGVPVTGGFYTVPARYYYYYNSTTTTTDTKGSPKTFDAGIALYVGMALTSAAGVAFVGKKRED